MGHHAVNYGPLAGICLELKVAKPNFLVRGSAVPSHFPPQRFQNRVVVGIDAPFTECQFKHVAKRYFWPYWLGQVAPLPRNTSYMPADIFADTRTHFFSAWLAASTADSCQRLVRPSGPGNLSGHRNMSPCLLMARRRQTGLTSSASSGIKSAATRYVSRSMESSKVQPYRLANRLPRELGQTHAD